MYSLLFPLTTPPLFVYLLLITALFLKFICGAYREELLVFYYNRLFFLLPPVPSLPRYRTSWCGVLHNLNFVKVEYCAKHASILKGDLIELVLIDVHLDCVEDIFNVQRFTKHMKKKRVKKESYIIIELGGKTHDKEHVGFVRELITVDHCLRKVGGRRLCKVENR